jgi:subtilisin family serine protease
MSNLIRTRASALMAAGIMILVLVGSAWPREVAAVNVGEIPTDKATSAGQLDFEPDHVLVQFQPAISPEERQSAHAAVGAVVVNRLQSIRVDVVRLQSPALTATEAVALYEEMPAVTRASLNYEIPSSAKQTSQRRGQTESDSGATLTCETDPALRDPDLPNDPMFCDQWALHNDGSVEGYDSDPIVGAVGIAEATGGQEIIFDPLQEEFDVDALDGWSLLKPASERETIRVAILESGINREHPDLVNANIVACARATGLLGEIDPTNCDDHSSGGGTLMAGIIAAERNNGIGIAGLAPEVELVIGKFIQDNDNSSSLLDYLAIIEWAKDAGADIINLDQASPFCEPPEHSEALRGFYEFEREVLESAYGAGVLIVAGAGGKLIGGCGIPDAPRYPAAYDFVMSVGGTNPRGEVYQNDAELYLGTACDETVDILAPSEWVYTTTPGWEAEGLRLESPGYDIAQGPSMSTPHVSGIAALVMSNEGLKPREVANANARKRLLEKIKERLLTTATDVEEHPFRPGECAGLRQVNLERALEAGLPARSRHRHQAEH